MTCSRTDAKLLAAAAEDPSAFRELYDRHASRVHRYLCRCTGDAEAAYDLTAETFAQAWLHRASFLDEFDGDAGPWLFAIARNSLLMSVRRARIERRATERLALELPRVQGDAAVPDERWGERADIELAEALARLTEGQRITLALRFGQDLAYDQIATRLDTTPQAARVRVHRALSALRRRLSNTVEVTP
jgi:RNA polymerase sigma-70 factor (ECF subfamily)